jgi:hypothetical protein
VTRARLGRRGLAAEGLEPLAAATGLVPPQDHGSLLWDFLTTFLAARRTFLSVFRGYERRVITAARRAKVKREVLRLPPRELAKLFHLRRLEALRDGRAAPLRDLAQRLFAEHGHPALIDVYCSHVFHELSILSEEHRSVRRFVRIRDRRSYAQLFQEVSRYYPVRLRRVRKFFDSAMRRIEALLPDWARERVIVRSAYLFGERTARLAYGEGIEALYRRMYPEGGAAQGFLEAARSFQESGFRAEAVEAARRSLAAAKGRSSRDRRAAREARALLSSLEA